MVQPRSGLYFAEEALGTHSCRDLGPEDFDSDTTVMFQIIGEVNCRHSPTAEFALDRVAPGEGDLQAGQLLGHRVAREALLNVNHRVRESEFALAARARVIWTRFPQLTWCAIWKVSNGNVSRLLRSVAG